MPNKKDQKNNDYSSFTVDSDDTGLAEVPSVTKLLNRKSLKLDSGKKPAQPPPNKPTPLPTPEEMTRTASAGSKIDPASLFESRSPTPPAARPAMPAATPAPPAEITVAFDSQPEYQLETSSGPATQSSSDEAAAPRAALEIDGSTPNPVVQPAARRGERNSAAKLIIWDIAKLKKGSDPLGKGLGVLFQKGCYSALFLSITAPPAGCPVPHFAGTAAVAPAGNLMLWTGLKWDPTVVPELWNLFIRGGFVELAPPGTKTNVASTRNVVRGAFGATLDEYLTLVRAGPANACRGVVAVLSKNSLLDDIGAALPLLNAATPTRKNAA